jgi:hypothetical protein
MQRPTLRFLCAITCLLGLIQTVSASSTADEEPINYSSKLVNDPIARLEKKIANNEVTLKQSPKGGYLASLLELLSVSTSSQTLVFSKTSFQRHHIWPDAPRALYFNNDLYIGWVKGGDVLEIASLDPQKGAIFYTLSQRPDEKPVFRRQTDSCLQCHESGITENAPGLLVRSVYPDNDGMPIFNAGTFRTSHESKLQERWGGWYVSGRHGDQLHMGNTLVKNKDKAEDTDFSQGSNITDLSKLFDTSAYLTPHSDIVALMVLEHQVKGHNLITRANHLTRIALRDEVIMNKALNRKMDGHSESTLSRIRGAGDPLLKYLLFVDEAPLSAQVEGSSGFAKEFQAAAPRDNAGRSLRDFDLKARMFKYPLSYLVYTEGFDALPEDMKNYFWHRLYNVLVGKDNSPEFARISSADRKAILEILRDTKAGLPQYFKK